MAANLVKEGGERQKRTGGPPVENRRASREEEQYRGKETKMEQDRGQEAAR